MKGNSRGKNTCVQNNKKKKRYFCKASPTFQFCCSSPELLLLAAICCLLNHGMTGNICLYRSQNQACTILLAPFLSFFFFLPLFPPPPPQSPTKNKNKSKRKSRSAQQGSESNSSEAATIFPWVISRYSTWRRTLPSLHPPCSPHPTSFPLPRAIHTVSHTHTNPTYLHRYKATPSCGEGGSSVGNYKNGTGRGMKGQPCHNPLTFSHLFPSFLHFTG